MQKRSYTTVVLGVVFVLVPQLATAQLKTTKAPTLPTVNPLGTFIQILLWLGLIIILVVFLIRFLSRKFQVQQKGSIQVLAARQLAPNRSVQVLEIQGKRYLVGVGEQVTLLADVTDDFVPVDESFDRQPFAPLFAQALESVRNRYTTSKSEGEDD